jgi:hypothetical protein
VGLDAELERIAAAAAAYAAPGERVVGVLPAEPREGARVYLCAYAAGESRSWLALDAAGAPVDDRGSVRDAASIAALCEVAEETAAGGDLDELLSRLVALRLSEAPPGIDEAEEAVVALQRTVGASPRVASAAHLEAVGAATRRVERALGGDGSSPFAEAMKAAMRAVDSLTEEVERGYKRPLPGGAPEG